MVFGCVISRFGSLSPSIIGTCVQEFNDFGNNSFIDDTLYPGLYMCSCDSYGDETVYGDVGTGTAGSFDLPGYNTVQYVDDASVYYYGASSKYIYDLSSIENTGAVMLSFMQPFIYLFCMVKSDVYPNDINPLMNVEFVSGDNTCTYYTIDFQGGDHASGSHYDYVDANGAGWRNYIGTDNISERTASITYLGENYRCIVAAPFRTWKSEYQKPTFSGARKWTRLLYGTDGQNVDKLHISSCWLNS